MIVCHESAQISPLADIEDSILGTVIQIGERTVVDSFVKIKPAGGLGSVVIGNDCFINSGVVIYSGNGVSIGDGTLIAANCTIAATNHEIHASASTIPSQGFMKSRGGRPRRTGRVGRQ